MEPTSPWKKPNEVMKLYRLRKKKLALQKRMSQPLSTTSEELNGEQSDISRICEGDKRKNPFAKYNEQNKKHKPENTQAQLDESNDKTLFTLLNLPSKPIEKPQQEVDTEKLSTFSNLLQKFTAEHTVQPKIVEAKYKALPVDWALKTKMRLMSSKPFAWTAKLKASEEASGITGFVRCVDTTKSPTLDTSPRARFHQTNLYWQHPHLPWINLYPRSSGKVAATNFMATNEAVKKALHDEWIDSFRSLFQCLRALHCPYFYVCANTFTCLFRAGGLGGASQPSALLAPSTSGLRNTLRHEDVEFTMPLRPDKKRLNTSNEDRPKNSSVDSCYDTIDSSKSQSQADGTNEDEDCSGDEDDSDAFMSQLGLPTDVIKKINNNQVRIANRAESSVDKAAESLVHVTGTEVQALFNFLLNCKSLVSPTGPFAGIPPTLLSPTAFHGGTLQSLHIRENTIYVESDKYYSIEVRGPVLPTAVHSLFEVLKDTCPAPFSVTFAHLAPTLAFSWAANAIAQDAAKSSEDNEPNQFTKVFNKENLSDCGLSEDVLQKFCSADSSVVKTLDSVKYNPEDDTYTW